MYETFGGFDLQYRCAMDYDLLLKLKINQLPVHISSFYTGKYAVGWFKRLIMENRMQRNTGNKK